MISSIKQDGIFLTGMRVRDLRGLLFAIIIRQYSNQV